MIKRLLWWFVFLALAAPAQAQIAFRSAASAADSTFGYRATGAVTSTQGSATVALPSGTAAGDLLILQAMVKTNNAITAPSGWTLLDSDSQGQYQALIFYKIAAVTETAPTLNPGASIDMQARIFGFSGVDQTTPIESGTGVLGYNGNTSTSTGAAVTASVNASIRLFLPFSAGAYSSAATPTGWTLPGSGFQSSNNLTLAAFYRTVTATGTQASVSSALSPTNSNFTWGTQIVIRPGYSGATDYLVIGKPSGTVANDVMVATVGFRPRSVSPSSTPSGWTQVNTATQTNGGTNGMILRTYVKVAGSAEPNAYLWAFPSGFEYASGGILSFSGVDTASPVNQNGAQAAGNGSSYVFTTPTITPTVNNAMLVASFAYQNADGWSKATGYTAKAVDVRSPASANGTGMTVSMDYLLQSTAASTSATATANSNYAADYGATQLLALKPGGGLDHIQIEDSGSGLTCQPSTITVKACVDSGCSSLYSSSVTATLSSTAGSWSANPITFTGSTTVTLSVTSPQTVTLGTTVGGVSPTPVSSTICYAGATQSCQLAFADTGFTFSTVPNQVAGATSGNITLQAVQKAGNSPNCVSTFNNKTVTLDFASQCVNPTSCQAGKQISITTTSPAATIAIANNPSSGITSYTPVTLSFDNTSTATFTLGYPDVGQMSLSTRYALGGGSYMTGTSNNFVVVPYGFTLAATCADGTTNGASQSSPSAADPRFCRAGKSFSIVATAVNQAGAVTPNYGNETPPAENVAVTWSRQLPAPGADGVLPTGNPAAVGSGVFGTATNYAWNWDEVGILKATTSVGDGNYLGAGNVSSTAYVGRFYPDHFDVVVTPQCSTFVYSGIPLTTVVPGQPFTVKASAMNGKTTPTVTTNYNSTGGFAKPVDLSLVTGGGAGNLYVDSTAGGTGAIPAAKFASGVGQVNYNDTSGKISYVFSAFPAAATAIAIHADDAETATSTGTNGTATVYAGRLWLGNAFGSDRAALTMPYEFQYWNGSTFVKNTADTCTSFAAANLGLGNYQGAITSANMGIGHFSVGANTGGGGNIAIAAPTSSAAGSVDVAAALGTTTAPATSWTPTVAPTAGAGLPWLRGKWYGTTYDRDPAARATFGVFGSNLRKGPIFIRENY